MSTAEKGLLTGEASVVRSADRTGHDASSSGARAALVPGLTQRDTLHALRLLTLYRFMTPLFQAGTMVVVAQQFSVGVDATPVFWLLALELLVAVATYARLHSAREVGVLELQLHGVLDIGLFTAMLFLTGGIANPFAPLYVLPVMIVGMALPPARLWLLVVLTMVCYAMLREFHVELSHPQGEGEVYRLHENGMIINYMFTAALLVFFSSRLVRALRLHAQQAGAAREAQMRSEAVAAIGGIAASAAHELSSPIGTVAMVAEELRQRYTGDPQLQADLGLIEEQMMSCKKILTRMAEAGGVRRAESASGVRLDDFVRATVRCVQSTNPGASVATVVDGATPAPRIVVEESLRQALANMVQNAINASPQHVQVTARWDSNDLVITVVDSGPGFSEELLTTLGKGSVRSGWPRPGMGVGLLLGAQVAQGLEGSLDFSNNAAGGACVRLRLPLARLAFGPAQGAGNAGH